MPKRKSEDDYEKLLKKFKKLEKKVRRHCRDRSRSRSPSSDNRYRSESQDREKVPANNEACEFQTDVAQLLGETTPVICIDQDTAPIAQVLEPSTSIADCPIQVSPCDQVDPGLDCAILEILGEDPTISNTYGAEIHKDLAIRLEHIATHGLSKELRKEITEKYLLPGNCKLINAPVLNAEIKAAVSDMIVKRDKNIEIRQKQIATAISCLGQALNRLISSNNADPELTKTLMDTERILCDSQHNDSVIRRNFILSSLKKDMKDQLQNTRLDNLLFGENLSETIKTAKAISKSGADLKAPVPKPPINNRTQFYKQSQPTATTSRNLNWKGPYPRKPPNQQKKEPPQNKARPPNSSRHSQQQPTRGRR